MHRRLALRGLLGMVLGMSGMPMGDVRVVPGLGVLSLAMVLRRLLVMGGCTLMMHGRFLVVFRDCVRHRYLSVFRVGVGRKPKSNGLWLAIFN
ncbi:protein of unknown function [Methylacidimicrobium sp. AP8]|nr:protein of unknown function [Methylacidimicrobium sp. AP8]